MKFIVSKTSDPSGDIAPINGSREEEYTHLDIRTIPTLERARHQHWFQDWWDNGTNHQEKYLGKFICCEKLKPYKHWVLDVSTLEELLSLVAVAGRVVVSSKSDCVKEDYAGEIEIYDGYRE